MGVENGMFRSEIGSGFEDTGGTPPPRIPRSTPPGMHVIAFRTARLAGQAIFNHISPL